MFSKFPPKISVPLFYAFITSGLLLRFLIGNLYGIFILCVIFYANSENLIGTKPFSVEELIYWLAIQNESTKTSIISSLITVIGFMLAYATATANWKGQLLANIKIQAASEIDIFFSEYSKLATDCKIYSSALVEAVNKIQRGCSVDEAAFLSNYNRAQGEIFFQKRQRLISMGIDVHGFQGRYSTLLISTPGLKSRLDSAIKAIEHINDKLWINLPFHIQDDNNPIQTFVNQVNVADNLALIAAIENNHGELNFSSGGLKGALMSPVIVFNGWSMFHLYREHKNFYATIKERYTKSQRNN